MKAVRTLKALVAADWAGGWRCTVYYMYCIAATAAGNSLEEMEIEANANSTNTACATAGLVAEGGCVISY